MESPLSSRFEHSSAKSDDTNPFQDHLHQGRCSPNHCTLYLLYPSLGLQLMPRWEPKTQQEVISYPLEVKKAVRKDFASPCHLLPSRSHFCLGPAIHLSTVHDTAGVWSWDSNSKFFCEHYGFVLFQAFRVWSVEPPIHLSSSRSDGSPELEERPLLPCPCHLACSLGFGDFVGIVYREHPARRKKILNHALKPFPPKKFTRKSASNAIDAIVHLYYRSSTS